MSIKLLCVPYLRRSNNCILSISFTLKSPTIHARHKPRMLTMETLSWITTWHLPWLLTLQLLWSKLFRFAINRISTTYCFLSWNMYYSYWKHYFSPNLGRYLGLKRTGVFGIRIWLNEFIPAELRVSLWKIVSMDRYQIPSCTILALSLCFIFITLSVWQVYGVRPC